MLKATQRPRIQRGLFIFYASPLQSHFTDVWNLLERETGIEPATNGLGSRYSTIELLPLRA